MPNYLYNGNIITEDRVIGAAENLGLSVDEYVSKYGFEAEGEQDTAIERAFGKNVVTDFFGDLYRAGAQGMAQGASVEEAFDVYQKGASISDEELQAFINADQRIQALGVSDEMKEYERIKNEAGGGVFGFMKGMLMTRGQILPQVIVSSMASMVRTAFDSEEAAAATITGAAAGSFIPVIGTLGGAIAGVSGSLETATTFSQLLKEKLGDKEFTKENIRALLEDEDSMIDIKGKALARGATIGAIEGLTAGLARNVAGKLVDAGKSVRKTGAIVTGIEATGGATGEALGQVAAGQDFDIADVLLEGFAEAKGVVNVADILTKKSYKVNNKAATRKQVTKILQEAKEGKIATKDLYKINIEVTGDQNLSNAIQKIKQDAFTETQINASVSDVSDRKKLVELNKQLQIAEANTKKTGIFKDNTAQIKLESIQARIDTILNKYAPKVGRPSKERVAGIETRKAEAREALAFSVEENFQTKLSFAKKHAGLYNLELDDSLSFQEIQDQFGEEAAQSAGFVDEKSNRIIINKSVAKLTNNVNVGNHELLHGILRKAMKEGKITKTLIQDLKTKLGDTNWSKVEKRIDDGGYRDLKTEDGKAYLDVNPDEYITLLSDAIANNEIKMDQTLFQEIGEFLKPILRAFGFSKINFDTADAVYDFLKEYNKSIHKGALSSAITQATVDTDATSTARDLVFSREASDRVQQIYETQGENGIIDILEEFKPITARLAEKRRNAPNFDKELLMTEIEIGERGILDLVRSYDISKGVPLAAYINQNLPKRAIEASRRVLGEEFTADVTEAKGIAAKETADVETSPKPKKKEIVLAERLKVSDKTSKKIEKVLRDLDITDLNFKTLKNQLPEVIGELFGISPKKIISGANITKKELQTAQMFINKNADLLIAMLPEGATASGTATGIPNTLLKAFYTKTERAKAATTGSKAGLAIQQKNNINKKDFLETFGIINGKPDRTDRNTSARVLALANTLGKMMTNQEVRKQAANTDVSQQTLQAIKDGKSELVFSRTKVEKFAKENGFDMEKDFYYPGDSITAANRYFEDIKLIHAVFGDGFLNANNINRAFDSVKDPVVKQHIRDLFNGFDFGDGVTNGFEKREFSQFVGKTASQIKNNSSNISIFNKQAENNFKHMWTKINQIVSKKETRRLAIPLMYYLQSSTVDRSHPQRAGAIFEGYDTTHTGTLYFEHALQNANTFNGLMGAVLGKAKDVDGNTIPFKQAFKIYRENYKLIGMSKVDADKLNAAKYIDNNGKKVSFANQMGKDWNIFDGGKWWQRYFNRIVYSQNKGINPNNFFVTGTKDTFAKAFNINAKGESRVLNTEAETGQKYSRAVQKQRQTQKYHENKRGMSTFDFDETLIIDGENFITAKKGDETVKISSSDWPLVGQQYADNGYTFDFKDFVNVRGGKEGPLLQKMRNQIKKFGNKNVFVLTARMQESDVAIHGWLKSQGINIPIENITGLGNSTGEAKALWMANKFAEGYNDMYFVDDALPNVTAVKNILDQLDVKSNVQQARLKFARDMSDDFNQIIQDVKGIDANEKISATRAKRRGSGKGRFRLFIPPSHEDFVGLLYNFMGKGEQGNKHRDFFEKALIKPLNKAYREYNAATQAIANDYKNLVREFPQLRKLLTKKTPDGDFFYSDAVRVYLWDKFGFNIPNLNEADKKSLVNLVKADADLVSFADTIGRISRVDDGYVQPTETWDVGDIKTDLADATNKVGRKKYFAEFVENAETIFSKDNLNKIEASFGSNFREALEDILYRTINGTNRKSGNNRLVNSFMDYLNGSVGATMFFNARSAVLQQLSFVNFLNFSDNNVFKASKAFANQKQFWSDYLMIFNSDMLKQRRQGASFDLNTNELSQTISKSKEPVRALIRLLLQKGFLPTQIADSNAIALGGAAFYRNRVDTYLQQGLNKKEAETKAFADFQEVAEATQQSARPDMISQQQASPLGRLVLAFQNVTSQYTRLIKKSGLDLINRRKSPPYNTQTQSDMANISKIVYYGAVQNMIFYALQTGLFALMFGEDEEQDEKTKKFFDKKKQRVLSGSIDSVLRGMGIGGAVISTIKNAAIKFTENKEKSQYIKSQDPAWQQLITFMPPVDIKFRKFKYAERDFVRSGDVMKEMPTFDIDNPVWSATTNVIEGGTNVPLNRLYEKTMNIREAMDDQNEWWQRLFMWAGWSRWNFGIKNEEVDFYKKQVKDQKKKQKKKKTQQPIYYF